MFRAKLQVQQLEPDSPDMPGRVNLFEFTTEDARDAFLEGVGWAYAIGFRVFHTCEDHHDDEGCYRCQCDAIEAAGGAPENAPHYVGPVDELEEERRR